MENTKEKHGGDLLLLSKQSNKDINSLLDFSINIRPEGMPEFLKAAILKTINLCERYPSPKAEEAKKTAAEYFDLNEQNFVFGNGSNEILHASLDVLALDGYKTLCTFEPAFSEYSIAAKKVGLDEYQIIMPLTNPLDISKTIEIKNENNFNQQIEFAEDYSSLEDFEFSNLEKFEDEISKIPHKSIVIFANPGNPSGIYFPLELCKKWVDSRKDCIFIFDEAFIDYLTHDPKETAISLLSENCMILRSLTKFYSIASLRLGYLVCEQNFARKLQEKLPVWNVNAMALACIEKIFTKDSQKIIQDAKKTRENNVMRRFHLYSMLQKIDNINIYPSKANYVLFSLPKAPKNLWERLLKEYGIVLRNCSNYVSLECGNYFRVAVRFPSDHEKLVRAIQEICGQETKKNEKKKTPALMLLGTSSNAGKSVITAAFCRIFTEDGYRVKPFKAQNMSLNSGVTALGEEMGRAQIVQAQAAKVDPDARMNPILLKPHSDTGSQVVLLGKAMGHFHIKDYYEKKAKLWDTVCTAYDELAESCDVMVLEGAGSPAEVNLKEVDIVNIRMAEYAKAATLLVGDIDRGGIYASFLGTWLTFTPSEEKCLTGYLVNRFRGDASLLNPAHDYLLEHTNKPVLGVVPFIKDIKIPEEDMAGTIWAAPDKKKSQDYALGGLDRPLDIAIIQLAHISNHTDFEPLGIEEQCHVRAVRTKEEFGNPDLLILPGSKSVSADLQKLQESGLTELIIEHAKDKWILGICGGLQMMGLEIFDPLQVESTEKSIQALGLININSEFAKDKTLTAISDVKSPLGTLSGYEIHHGISDIANEIDYTKFSKDLVQIVEKSFWHNSIALGYFNKRRWATYVHGLFDEDEFRHNFLNHVRQDLGLNPLKHKNSYDMEIAFTQLAKIVRENVDMEAIYKAMGLK